MSEPHIVLICTVYKRLSQMEYKKQADCIMIRHAESEANIATENYVNENNILYDWEHLSSDKTYLETIKYSHHLLDPSITPTGRLQCQAAQTKLEGYSPDVILVSPLNRALLTCSLIFSNPKCKVIVQPLIAEGLRSASDFSCQIESKKKMYPDYDFGKVEALGAHWVISNQSQQNKAKYQGVIDQSKDKPFNDILKSIFAYSLKSFIYETPSNLRQRAQRVKQLLKEYRKQYEKIAVVTHYNIIRFILATEFNEKDEPFHCHIDNCEIRPVKIEQL